MLSFPFVTGWGSLPALCWIKGMCKVIFVLFQVLEKNIFLVVDNVGTGTLVYYLYYVKIHSISLLFGEHFLTKVEFYQIHFYACNEVTVFVSLPVTWYSTVPMYVKLVCITSPSLTMVNYLSNMLLNWFAGVLLSIFPYMFIKDFGVVFFSCSTLPYF